MAAFRYWRFNLKTRNVNARIWVKDLEIRGTPGGPDLTSPGGPFTVNQSNWTNVGAFAIDGDPNTAWESSGIAGVATGTYDFGAATDVAQVAVLTDSEYSGPSDGSYVSASNDGAEWTRFGPNFSNMSDWLYGALHVLTLGAPASGEIRQAGKSLRLNTEWSAQFLGARGSTKALRVGVNVGPYRVAGNVYIDGTPDVPVSRRVRLFNRATAECVRETWSDAATGAYAFEKVPMPMDGYSVVTYDHLGVFNAVIKDRITPAP